LNKVTLIYGPPFSGQRERLLSLLVRQLSSCPGAPTYALLPTRQAALELNRCLLAECPSGAVVGLKTGTIKSLAEWLHSSLPRGERPITPLEKEAVVRSLLTGSDFPKLAAAARLGGVPRRLAEFISLAKRGLWSPRLLREALTRKRRIPAEWEAELGPLMLAYDRWLSKHALLDPDDLLLAVTRALESAEVRLPRNSLAAAHGFFHLCPLELRFVKSLLVGAAEGIFTLDYYPDADGKLSASSDLFQNLKEFASQNVRTGDGPGWPQSLFVQSAESGRAPLFRLELSEHLDTRREVESVAGSVKKLLRSEPMRRPSSVKIVANDLASYGPLFRDVFSQYGIPLRIPAGRALISSPVVSAALALLEAPLQNFSRRSVLRIFSMPFVELPTKDGTLSAELLDRVARAARIVEGFGEWRERLEQLQRIIELQTERNPEYHDPVEDEIARLREGLGVQRFSVVRAAILQMLDRLKSLTVPLVPAEFHTRYLEQLEYFRITRLAPTPAAETPEARRPFAETALSLSRLLEVVARLVSALELCSPSPRPLDDYYHLLRSAVSSERVDEPPPSGDAIELHWGPQMRTAPADYVFVVGATESDFPGTQPRVGLHQAEELRSLGLLAEPPGRVQSRFLFYSYIASARKGATVSWAASDGRAAFLRSPFVDEIEGIASLAPPASVLRRPDTPPSGTLAHLTAWLGEVAAGGEPPKIFSPLLSALAHQRPGVVKGLVRGLESWHVRAASPGATPYDGAILAPNLRTALQKRFAETIFSVTSLESYAACPYRFFLERILKLLPLGEPEEAVSPLNWGSAVHKALRKFMAGRRKGAAPIPVFAPIPDPEDSPLEFSSVLEEMRLRMDQEISGLPHRTDDAYFLSLRDNLLGGPGPHEDGGFVEAFLRSEAERQALGFVPAYFELYFGPPPRPNGSDNLLTGPSLAISGSVLGTPLSIRVFGEIDRVDLLQGTRAVVYDYKTGSANPPGKPALRDGTALQPPIYLLAACKLLRDAGIEGVEPFACAYYRARDSRRAGPEFILYAHPVPGVTPTPTTRTRGEEKFQELIAQTARFALAYAYGMISGLFPPLSGGGSCRYCDYTRVCRRGDLEVSDISFPVALEDVVLES